MSSDDDTERTIPTETDEDMTCVLDAAGVFVRANRSFLDAFDVPRSELIGARVDDAALAGTFRALLERSFDEALAGEDVSMQRWWDFPTLGFRYVRIRLAPRRDAAPETARVARVAVRIRDLTDAKLAQAALESSELRFDDFAGVVGEGLWELDANLRFVYVSPRFESIMAMAGEDILGKRRVELFPGEDASAPATREHFLELDACRPFEDYRFTRVLADGGQRSVRMSGVPVYDANGRFRGYRGVVVDLSDERRLEGRITDLETLDPLTGLVNRREFLQRLERVVETAAINASEHGLCYADVDRFRAINDAHGHAAGDRMLAQLAAFLATQVRRRDTLARVGGNAFAILMEHCSLAHIEHVAENLRRAVAGFRYAHPGETIELTVTVGVVPIDARTGSVDRVLRAADRACYAGKSAGGDRILVYGQPDRRAARERRIRKPEPAL